MNDILELSADYALSRVDFLNYLDDYIHGSIIIIENNSPVAHLVRRNIISFSYVEQRIISIEIKIKRGSVWRQAKVSADLDQNPKLLDRFNEWSIPH
ncbi:hypothetical protein J2X73_004304 [Novosphingobium sp. 1748]|uniref:hypothetical protein n=1 Tax=Novosphingobium sp. 1748 TaxID=2817760 RepID=UPI002855F2C4|nr:hypothetical protein [Novosphingobium sp. 1748]MDR6709906.1 hypothetical protein [Novosphingobium sp. 1748]